MLYRFLQGLARIVFSILFRLKAIGLENIPKHGPVILCCNHTSLWDPPILGTRMERKVYFMAREELFKVPGLGWLIRNVGAFPVKRGGVSKESIRRALEILRQNNVLGIFPEGTRNNTTGMGKKGAASLAVKSNSTIVPVAIVGGYRLFRSTTVIYGKPMQLIYPETPTSEDLENITAEIMKHIYELKSKYSA